MENITNKMLYDILKEIKEDTKKNTNQISMNLGEAKQRPFKVCREYVNKRFATVTASILAIVTILKFLG